MDLVRETIALPEAMTGYLVRPPRTPTPLPAVLVIPDMFGLDAHLRDVADRFAAAGFVALAPDLFARAEPRDFAEPEQIVRHSKHAALLVRWLGEQPLVRARKVGSVGFGLGGAVSALLATDDIGLHGAVVLYGQPPAADRLAGVSCPMLCCYGEEDRSLVQQLPAFTRGMKDAGKRFELYVYPNAPHGFFNDTGDSYRADASRDAWARTLAFFAKHL